VVFGEGLHFCDGGLEIGIRELVRSFAHVLEGEVIGLEELEVIDAELDDASNLEVGVQKVPAFTLVVVLLPLQEFAAPDA
jgi:hypothetical protein